MGTKPDESWDKNPTPNPVTTLQNPVPPSRTQRVERTPVVGRGRKTSQTVKAGPNPVPTRSQPDQNPITNVRYRLCGGRVGRWCAFASQSSRPGWCRRGTRRAGSPQPLKQNKTKRTEMNFRSLLNQTTVHPFRSRHSNSAQNVPAAVKPK